MSGSGAAAAKSDRHVGASVFLRNLLLNENHPLHNRTLHISGAFQETEKPDIDAVKPDIKTAKPDIDALSTVFGSGYAAKTPYTKVMIRQRRYKIG